MRATFLNLLSQLLLKPINLWKFSPQFMLFVFLHKFPLDRYFFILIGGVDLLYIVMVYTGHCQTSKMELFAKMVQSFYR